MANTSPKLTWCVIRFGKDMNWWVDEISDTIHWDVDGLSIIDPRQLSHIQDLIDPLRDYGLQEEILENAFFSFRIKSEEKGGRVKLVRTSESVFETDDKLFALPDILDEEKGAYADFLDHITKLRVKMLNDLIDFEQRFTEEELEEEIREAQNNDFIEGKATHMFNEVLSILEFIPDGFTLEAEDDVVSSPSQRGRGAKGAIDEDDLPDVEEEIMEADETMRWDEDEDEESDDDSFDSEEDEDL